MGSVQGQRRPKCYSVVETLSRFRSIMLPPQKRRDTVDDRPVGGAGRGRVRGSCHDGVPNGRVREFDSVNGLAGSEVAGRWRA